MTAEPGFGPHQRHARSGSGLSLLFAKAQRPTVSDIERLLGSDSLSGQRARITCRSEEGWLELLVGGLSFDLTGLAPARGNAVPPMEHCFGIAPTTGRAELEAVTLLPGEHVAGGRAMLPLLRAMIGLAAGLAVPLLVEAVCWEPSGCWMAPDYFTRVAVNWLSGGGFPAMGLTALKANEDGSIVSNGLAFFAGQELRIEPAAGLSAAESTKLAVRVIDHVVRHGRLTSLCELRGEAGDVILAEPSHDGSLIRVWRAS